MVRPPAKPSSTEEKQSYEEVDDGPLAGTGSDCAEVLGPQQVEPALTWYVYVLFGVRKGAPVVKPDCFVCWL